MIVAYGQRSGQDSRLQPQIIVMPVIQNINAQQVTHSLARTKKRGPRSDIDQSFGLPVVVKPVVQNCCGFGDHAPRIVPGGFVVDAMFQAFQEPAARHSIARIAGHAPGLAKRQRKILRAAPNFGAQGQRGNKSRLKLLDQEFSILLAWSEAQSFEG